MVKVTRWKYGHPQNHDSEELMQNGIFFTGDKFDVKICFFHFTKWEFFFIMLNTNNSDLYVLCAFKCLLFQCQINQTGGKPQNSPLVTVKSSFHVSSTGRKLFSASTTDHENYLSQSSLVNFVVFYWFDLVWYCTNKVQCVLKK